MRKVTMFALAAGAAAFLSFSPAQAVPVTPGAALPLLEQGNGVEDAQYYYRRRYYCRWVYRRVWTYYGWRVRRVRVCG
jgi:hypothetical protein